MLTHHIKIKLSMQCLWYGEEVSWSDAIKRLSAALACNLVAWVWTPRGKGTAAPTVACWLRGAVQPSMEWQWCAFLKNAQQNPLFLLCWFASIIVYCVKDKTNALSITCNRDKIFYPHPWCIVGGDCKHPLLWLCYGFGWVWG